MLDAFPDERIRGQVTKISREGTTVSDVVVYNVMVDPVKVPAEWASGMTADVEFMVDRKDDILVVPKSAVNERDGGKFVMVINGGLSSRKIETGITDGKMIEVTKGLTGGETVAIGATGAAVEQRSSRRPPMMMVPR